MILVTAANGNQGKLLIPKLLRAGFPIRASVQSAASADALYAVGVTDVVVGDLADADVRKQAVRGIETIYYIGPTLSPSEREIGFAIIDDARKENVRHFVMSSVLHAITTDLIQHETKRDVEEHLLSSGLEFTILQPANYMMAHRLKPAFEHGIFSLSWSLERRQSMVDIGDITDVAALVLGDTDHHIGATYELVSPGRFSAHDLGDVIAAVLDKPIQVREIDADTFATMTLKDADPGTQQYKLGLMRSISTRYSNHDFVGNPNVLTWLLGRTPTTFEDFVRAEYTAFKTRAGA